jgi:septal ring factor EnvC (AmiA/AmiB activator)
MGKNNKKSSVFDEIIKPKLSSEGLSAISVHLLFIGILAVMLIYSNFVSHKNLMLQNQIKKQNIILKNTNDSLNKTMKKLYEISIRVDSLQNNLSETEQKYYKIRFQYENAIMKNRSLSKNVSKNLLLIQKNLYHMNQYIRNIERQLGGDKRSGQAH